MRPSFFYGNARLWDDRITPSSSQSLTQKIRNLGPQAVSQMILNKKYISEASRICLLWWICLISAASKKSQKRAPFEIFCLNWLAAVNCYNCSSHLKQFICNKSTQGNKANDYEMNKDPSRPIILHFEARSEHNIRQKEYTKLHVGGGRSALGRIIHDLSDFLIRRPEKIDCSKLGLVEASRPFVPLLAANKRKFRMQENYTDSSNDQVGRDCEMVEVWKDISDY